MFNLEQTSLALGSGVFGRCRFSKAPALPCSCTGLFVCFSLQCTSFIPEARAVLDLVDQCPKEVQKGKFQVIAIEGLDATGKQTLLCSFLSMPQTEQLQEVVLEIINARLTLGHQDKLVELSEGPALLMSPEDTQGHAQAVFILRTKIRSKSKLGHVDQEGGSIDWVRCSALAKKLCPGATGH